MSNYYRYWKPEGKAVWKLFQDSDQGIQDVIAKGAHFYTILSIDQDIDKLDSETKVNYKGPLYFDIDCDDEHKSLADCRKLLLSLYKDYGVNLNQLAIHCTGGKGFHIVVPAKIFSTGKANQYLPYTYKNMAVTFGLEFLDYSIYSGGKGRMWRIENIKRTSGRYKVQLTAAQIFSLDFDDIYQLTLHPGNPTVEPKNVDFSAELSALFKRSEYRPQKIQAIGCEKLKGISGDPACIRHLLKAEKLKEGKRFNQLIMALAAYAVGKGWSIDDIESRSEFMRGSIKSSAYKSDRDKLSHVKAIFKFFASAVDNPQYQFACQHMQHVVDVVGDDCPQCPLMAQIEADEYDPLLGLMVINNCFYKRSESGKTQLTTFNIMPTAVIEYIDSHDSEFTMHAQLISTNNLKMPIVFTQPDWGSKSAFIKKLPHPDFAYLGGDTDVSRLFHVLGQINVPKKIGVRTIGMHLVKDKWHFVGHEGSLGPNGERDELLLESDYPLHTKLISESDPDANELKQMVEFLFKFNALEIVVPLVGWFVSTFYKERIFSFTRQFPLLFIFGAAGSGKTQTILALKNIYALSNDNIKSIADVTNFTLIKSAASNNTIPLMLDEYKSSTFSQFQVKMVSKLIRAAYNNEAGERGTAGQRIMTYYYKSPIIIAGEQTVSEPAAKDRIIEVHLTRAMSTPHTADFEVLRTLPLPKLGHMLLNDSVRMEQTKLKELYAECFKAVPEAYKDRPRVNQAVMLLGLRLLEELVKPYGLDGIIRYNLKHYWAGRVQHIEEEVRMSNKSDVDRILEAINTMAENNRTALFHGQDYVIENGILKLNMRVIYANFAKFADEYKLDADTPNYTSFVKLIKKESYFVKDDQPTKLGQHIRLCMFLDVKKLQAKNLVLTALIEPTKIDESDGELKP
jgi:hypothetical protein